MTFLFLFKIGGIMPNPGDALSINDLDDIMDSLNRRVERYPDESIKDSIGVILFNLGDKYTKVWCINGEWEGIKKDLIPTSGIPKCPNGHVMFEKRRVQLGWVPVNE